MTETNNAQAEQPTAPAVTEPAQAPATAVESIKIENSAPSTDIIDEEAALNAGASESVNPARRDNRDSNNRPAKKQKYAGKYDRDRTKDKVVEPVDRKQLSRSRDGSKYGHDHFAMGGKGKEKAAAAAEEDDEGEGEGGEGKKRLPKKRVALLIGYCGTGYQGMQIQPDQAVKTIEGDVFAALVKAGAVSEENAESHRKVDVQRSARTDAGVHAAGNVISLKMIYDPPLAEGFTTLRDYVNSFLPEQIRMWGFVRTMKSFQARTACDSRVYEYLLPSYCLLPPASTDVICIRLNESSPGWRDGLGPGAEFADAAPEMPEVEEGADKLDPRQRGEYERRRGWRVDEGTMSRFRALIDQYHGTHNFHNYTVGKPFNDRTVKRHMIKIEVRDPVVHGDIEWVSVRIHGQSFMLHQIRKMMALAMLACRTNTPPSLLPETFGPKKIHIPKAPPLGLLLQSPVFKTYNDRIKSIDNAGNKRKKGVEAGEGDLERDPVDLSIYEEEMEAFKFKWIYEKLRQDELELNVFHKWIRQVDCSSSAVFSFLNSKGIIPPEAAQGKARQQVDKKENDAQGEGDNSAEADQVMQEKDDFKLDESDDEDIDQGALRRGELEG